VKRLILALLVVAAILGMHLPSARAECTDWTCESPEVATGDGALTAAYVAEENGRWYAANVAPPAYPYTYQLIRPCVADDRNNGICRANDFVDCPTTPDRVVENLVIERRRLVLPDNSTIDGFPTGGTAPGSEVGPWMTVVRACVDITALNPAPSPGEVFRYFQTLPLPELTTQQQPPGNGLVNLPVIFYTDSPTTQTFTVDIRGFRVVIQAGAVSYTWHTGDGTELISEDPGAPYPNQTVTHDYSSGSYTASLTTTWGATYTVNGGAAADVPGTTTTDGPPETFSVLQARPVLTNPFD
jgi:hypothetical protein